MRSKIEPQQPELFKPSDVKVGVLQLGGAKARSHQFTYGLDAVCRELSANVTHVVTPETVDECDIALCSLCSTQDVMQLILSMHERPKRARLVVGGQGAYSFPAWRHLTHRIAFGRAENAVDACILANDPLPWCYDYDMDPSISRKYEIRQARKLLEGESSVGCDGACKFCQYRATRRLLGGAYSAAGRGFRVTEDRWERVQAKSGHQTTALDGWSEATRRKVAKPVSDGMIIETLSKILESDLPGKVFLKIFQIVGYPWETAETVRADVLKLREVLGKVRPGKRGNRIIITFTVTPFSPEPLTAMEDEPADITTDWRGLLLGDDLRCVFDSLHMNAFTLPQIPGPLTLYRRIAVNRGATAEQLRRIAKAKTIEDAVSVAGALHERGAGSRVSSILMCEAAK